MHVKSAKSAIIALTSAEISPNCGINLSQTMEPSNLIIQVRLAQGIVPVSDVIVTMLCPQYEDMSDRLMVPSPTIDNIPVGL